MNEEVKFSIFFKSRKPDYNYPNSTKTRRYKPDPNPSLALRFFNLLNFFPYLGDNVRKENLRGMICSKRLFNSPKLRRPSRS